MLLAQPSGRQLGRFGYEPRFQRALPDHKHAPPPSKQLVTHFYVSLLIPQDFSLPKGGVRFWQM